MQSPPVPRNLVPLKEKHSPQHTILEHPMLMIIPPLNTTDQVSRLFKIIRSVDTWEKVLVHFVSEKCTVEPGYNDIGLYDTPSTTSYILWFQLIRHC
jgi:hypothetical protein